MTSHTFYDFEDTITFASIMQENIQIQLCLCQNILKFINIAKLFVGNLLAIKSTKTLVSYHLIFMEG